MSSDKYIPTSDGKEIINPDGSSISDIEGHQISKDTIPSFKKILVTDDGKDISNIALNYAVALSNSTGAELYILRILKDVEKFGDVTLEGSHESSKIDNNNYDLVVMLTSHIDSWFSSLFSDVRKIMNHISKPVLIIQ